MSSPFSTFLSTFYPLQAFEITTCTGGVVNVRVRARKIPPNPQVAPGVDQCFDGHSSVIMKYAPPYAAAVGEAARMDQNRQVAETFALNLLCSPENEDIKRKHDIRIPIVLSHNHQFHVLVLSDLGSSQTLSQYLLSLPHTSANATSIEAFFSLDAASSFGLRLGSFLADLHSPATLASFPDYIFRDLPPPQSSKESFVAGLRRTASSHLALFFPLSLPHPTHTVPELVARIGKSPPPGDIAFTNGDLSTGAILINEYTFQTPNPPMTSTTGLIGVIDWEFASLSGRALSGDISQLLALLHLHLLASQAVSPANGSTRAIISSLASSYRDGYQRDRTEWLTYSQNSTNPPAPTSPIAAVIRASFISHGQEMINNAIWKDWPCRCCSSTNSKLIEEKQKCVLLKEMVGKGAWYLARAGDDVKDFVEKESWRAIWAEEKVLRGLIWKGEET